MTAPAIEPERIPPLTRKFVLRVLACYKPHAARLFIAFTFILLGAVFTIIQPLILRSLVDQAASRTDDFIKLASAASLLVFLPVFSAALGVIQRRITGVIAADMQLGLRNRVYAHLQHLPYRMYVHAPPGEISARLSGDIQSTPQILLRTFPDGIGSLLRLLGSFAAMFALEWRLTLAALAVLPILGWVARQRNYTSRKLALNTMQANAALGLQVGETTQAGGIMNVRLFDRTRQEIERYQSLAAQARETDVAQNNLQANSVIWTSMIAAIGTAIVYAVGGILVFSNNTFSIGTVVAFVAYLGGLYAALQTIFSLPQSMALALVSYERIFELLDLPTEDPGPPRDNLPDRASGELCFQNITFRFDDEIPLRTTARPWSTRMMGLSGIQEALPSDENALENITFSVIPGKMTAIVGPSGAGKSTLFNLIPRFYDPNQGHISLDGEDLRTLPLEWLRRQISLVSQGIHVLPGTLGENLRYARPQATDAELLAACRAARLDEWLASLPNGLETFLGQSGARLSGGERQRLAIARALLKDAPVLLLDEATSHLDSINEAMLQDALFRVRQNRTTLVIAHRLSTVHDADEILVLDHGRIFERGTHPTLLALNGLYTRLYEKQFASEKRPNNEATQ